MQNTEPVEIFCQPGRLGIHATTRGWPHVWAAHPTDHPTAAWRCAMKHFHGNKDNGLYIYDQIRRTSIELSPELLSESNRSVWRATLKPEAVALKKTLTKLIRKGHSTKKGRKK